MECVELLVPYVVLSGALGACGLIGVCAWWSSSGAWGCGPVNQTGVRQWEGVSGRQLCADGGVV